KKGGGRLSRRAMRYHRSMDRNPELTYKTIEDTVGDTPLVRLKRLPGKTSNIVLAKLEGDNPAGSVKDRPAMSMIVRAEKRGTITHFVSSMGTTGTIMGCSRFFKEKNPKIHIIGCQPEEGSQIPGIRKWPEAYLPKIYDKARVDRVESVSQADAEEMARRMAREEGI